MPRYVYRCKACDAVLQFVHSMNDEKTDCIECGEKEVLQKIPSSFSTFNKRNHSREKVGSVVNSSIEDFKKDLKDQKKEAIKEYEPN